MIEDVYYAVSFSDGTYGRSAYYALDADDEGRIEEFVGAWDFVESCEEIDEDTWFEIAKSGEWAWYTAYPATGHAFWVLLEGRLGDHEDVMDEILNYDEVGNWEEYR